MILCINPFHNFVLFHWVETQDESVLFLIVFHNNALHLLYLDRFIKMKPCSMPIFLIEPKF